MFHSVIKNENFSSLALVFEAFENRLSFFLKHYVNLVVIQILMMTARVFIKNTLKMVDVTLLKFYVRLFFYNGNWKHVYALLEDRKSFVKSIEQAKNINVRLIGIFV